MERHIVERNMRFLVIELFWAAIAAGCISFNSAFIIRLGGSNLLVSLLTASAALVNAIAAVPFAAFMERQSNRRPWIVGSLHAFRIGYLVLIFIPWLPAYRAEAMVVWLMILNVPVALFTAGFLPLMGDVVPLERRARLFSARNMVLGATLMATTYLAGRWLDAIAFPLNYQLLYCLVLVTSMLSTWYVSRVIMPASPVIERSTSERITFARIRQLAREQRPFTNITINTLIFNLAVWMALPLQPIFFVRELHASDGWLGIWLALSSGGAILGNLFWPRLIERRGYSWVLLRSAFLSGIYFFLIAIFPDLNWILLFALLAGMINPGIEISHFNILLEVCPAARRATYLGVFVMIMNIGLFLSTIILAPVVDLVGARNLVLVLGGVRLFGALLFVVNRVRAPTIDVVSEQRV